MLKKKMLKVSPLTGVLLLLSKLPLGALQWLASLYSGLIGRINSARARHTVERNLLIAFPELSVQQRQQLSSSTLQAQFQSMLEFVKCWGKPPAWSIAQIKQVEGQHLLDQALNQRKGLILVLSHFGSWEVSNAWVSQFTDLVIMYKPSSNQPLEQMVLKARSSLGTTLVPTDKSGVRQMFAALK
ncbi:MAG: lipid A biosynthesis acyltransferase, partial [Moraxellaceae bacterium]